MADTSTRVTSVIPSTELSQHFKVDSAGNLTITSQALADAIKNKLTASGGAAGIVGSPQAIRVAVDSG